MHARKLGGDLDSPDSAGWAGAEVVTVALAPVALTAQPTEYIRTKWADRPFGTVAEVQAAAAHDGSRLYVRLDWADAAEPNGEFADAAAVYFPELDATPPATIGAPDAPARLWFWEGDLPAPRRLRASGPGVFRPDGDGVRAAAALDAGRWRVVLSGDLADATTAGSRLGIAVWNGANEERAGLGAVTTHWLSLEIE
jgi:DMSO reductase family type II enzyme heme b subunit